MSHNILNLASQSQSRYLLLKESQIPFKVIKQNANEHECDWNMELMSLVESIAIHKMELLVLDDVDVKAPAFVLTADTLVQDHRGQIHGKPLDYEDARLKLTQLRGKCRVASAFCLRKMIFKSGAWVVQIHSVKTVESSCIIAISDSEIEEYLKINPQSLNVAGALIIEGYGMQFVESVQGSYSGLLGLPLYELRQALLLLGFFN